MRHLDLFSGIGGFALAASWTWPNHEVAAFCDIDPFAHKVLNKHWPDVPIINDVRKIDREAVHGTIDLVTGGFPCQPFSQAGKRKGTDDDRYLWPEMHRIIAEFRPRWVLGENVSGLFTIEDGMAFERVCTDVEASGYEVWPLRIPACATGAPHRRDRWWFVAYTNSKRRDGDGRNQDGADSPEGQFNANNAGERPRLRVEDQQLDSVVTNPNGAIAGDNSGGHGEATGTLRGNEQGDVLGERVSGASGNPRNTESTGRTGGTYGQGQREHGGTDQWSRHWLEVASAFCRVDDGLPGQLDRDRKHRLKALGNAIVPQVAYQIMQAMKHADET